MLHTWTQDLRRHIHVHALMACGGLDGQGRWCAPKRSPTFLFPVHALSKVLRGKRTVAVNGPTFIARFLQHVLPPGFKRIRHCGLLSPGSMPRGWPPLVWR